MNIQKLVSRLVSDESCKTTPARGLPDLPEGLELPSDLRAFYETLGGADLFPDAKYSMELVSPDDFLRANPIIVGEECQEDISFDWFIVGRSGGQHVTIDLHPDRHGRCYDSFWDCHGVAGECAIIALSFSDLLHRLLEAGGTRWFWLCDDFAPLGDAYDE